MEENNVVSFEDRTAQAGWECLAYLQSLQESYTRFFPFYLQNLRYTFFISNQLHH